MINVKNLRKSYGSIEVLKGISFEIKKGTIYGFLGPNGAGKTTTMNILSGLVGFNQGEVFICGKNFKENKAELLKRVGYLPQNPVFYNYMNANEYLSFIGDISDFPQKKIKGRTEELLDIVGLKDSAKRKIGGYSGGMKQRLGIAVALFNNPDIIILDEPTSALDPEGRHEILDFIKKLKSFDKAVFFSTHILNDVERVCDEVSILDKGEILVSDNIDSLKNKYTQPIFDVEFERDCIELKEKLLNVNWVEKAIAKDKSLSVYVNDLEIAKTELLKLLTKVNNPILSFNLRKSNLEDIFIRLVNGNVNI